MNLQKRTVHVEEAKCYWLIFVPINPDDDHWTWLMMIWRKGEDWPLLRRYGTGRDTLRDKAQQIMRCDEDD